MHSSAGWQGGSTFRVTWLVWEGGRLTAESFRIFFSFYLLISTTSSSYGQGVSRDEGSTGASGAVAWDRRGAIQAYGKR